MLICYLWAGQINHKSIVMLTGVNKSTISDWMGFLRQLVSEDMKNSPEEVKVGGEGLIVEIDETKIAKRKYHRGHRVEGAWVVGGVEKEILRGKSPRSFSCNSHWGNQSFCPSWIYSLQRLLGWLQQRAIGRTWHQPFDSEPLPLLQRSYHWRTYQHYWRHLGWIKVGYTEKTTFWRKSWWPFGCICLETT